MTITGDDPLLKTAKVSFSGVIQAVNLAYVPEAKVGDYVVVHVGFALSVIDAEAAQKTLEDLQALEAIL